MFPSSSPPQILSWLKQVRFSLGNTSVYFDMNGDPPTGYDIICWIWRGTKWYVREVGSFSPDPITLTVDPDQIEWHNTGDSRLVSTFGVFSSKVFVKNLKTLQFFIIWFSANIVQLLERTLQKGL